MVIDTLYTPWGLLQNFKKHIELVDKMFPKKKIRLFKSSGNPILKSTAVSECVKLSIL